MTDAPAPRLHADLGADDVECRFCGRLGPWGVAQPACDECGHGVGCQRAHPYRHLRAVPDA